MVTAGCLEDPG